MAGPNKAAACAADKRGNTAVAIASDHMGHGADELPETILFYNGGASITTEGSESLENLKSMEAQGVEIFTCGTCPDYYGLRVKRPFSGPLYNFLRKAGIEKPKQMWYDYVKDLSRIYLRRKL